MLASVTFAAALDTVMPGQCDRSRITVMVTGTLQLLLLAGTAIGQRCAYGTLPGKFTADTGTWQPLQTECQLADLVQQLSAGSPENSQHTTGVLLLGDSVDRFLIKAFCGDLHVDSLKGHEGTHSSAPVLLRLQILFAC